MIGLLMRIIGWIALVILAWIRILAEEPPPLDQQFSVLLFGVIFILTGMTLDRPRISVKVTRSADD